MLADMTFVPNNKNDAFIVCKNLFFYFAIGATCFLLTIQSGVAGPLADAEDDPDGDTKNQI